MDIGAAAQLACLLEASAPKPGNVSPGRHFADIRYEHFLASAAAIGTPLSGAGDRPVGETILLAAQATSGWTRSNTNLGIVLLLAPLARAAFEIRLAAGRPEGRPLPEARLEALREVVDDVLQRTTVDDARHVFAAIRLASPGGLGEAPDQDVAGEGNEVRGGKDDVVLGDGDLVGFHLLPGSLEQRDEDRGRGQIGGGARVADVPRVAQRMIEIA